VGTGNYSLYIVRCADGSLYTGIATDVGRRIREHEDGSRGAKYLRGKGPLCLEFEQCLGDRSVASRVEFRIKQLDRERKEELIAGLYSLADLLPDFGGDDVQASGEACG
jgi:putative endonuclease